MKSVNYSWLSLLVRRTLKVPPAAGLGEARTPRQTQRTARPARLGGRMRYRFTAGAALLSACALSLTQALAPVPAQAGSSGPGLGQQRGHAAGPAATRAIRP